MVTFLLSDTKYNKHIDVTGNRFRSNEIVAGYVYKVLSKSYADYKTKLKKTGKATMTVKRSAVIDEILKDSTTSDMSTINDLCYAEANNTVSYKRIEIVVLVYPKIHILVTICGLYLHVTIKVNYIMNLLLLILN